MAQVTVPIPFTGCPGVTLAEARGGTNTYNNDPVTLYNLDITTGLATAISGGPLKDPANTANNIDINGAGLNEADGYLYAMNPGQAATPGFYRIGSNYGIVKLGTISAPSGSSSSQTGIVNPAAGEFDNAGNYYFTAVIGNADYSTFSYTPTTFYIGKIANASALLSGTFSIVPSYKPLDFTGTNCSDYYASISARVSQSNIPNTGLSDLTFNVYDGLIYTYVTFETPAGSGNYKGQILKLDPTTGKVICYNETEIPFNSNVGVAGVLITKLQDIEILLTNGDIYKAVSSVPGVYTGQISYVGASTIPAGATTSGLRGDLASCNTTTVTPVTFQNFTAIENDCQVKYSWSVAQEQNVNNYQLQLADNSGLFVSNTKIEASNSLLGHAYSYTVPVNNKLMTARVKETDNDGKIAYSTTVATNTTCAKTKNMRIINSIAIVDNVQIQWSNFTTPQTMSVTIYTAYGTQIAKQKILVSSFTNVSKINLGNISSGAYYISVAASNGDKYSANFIKQ